MYGVITDNVSLRITAYSFKLIFILSIFCITIPSSNLSYILTVLRQYMWLKRFSIKYTQETQI